MPALKDRLFAVIYTPYYRLQCARQKRFQALPEPTKTNSQLELSIELCQRTTANDLPDSERQRTATNDDGWRSSVFTDVHCRSLSFAEEKPAALLDSEGTRIIEVNSAAIAAGVEIGVSTSLALARTSELQIFAPAIDLEHQQQSALLQLCYRYSPYIENTAPGVCTLDLQGRKGNNQEWWARELLTQWRSLGFIAQIGIGPNPEIAWQAAKIARPFLQITAENSLLQSLPLESLNPSPYLFDILRNWGIRTLGALTRLPREEIGQRLGLEGLSLWDRAAGRSKNVLKQSQPPETFIESVDLEQRLETLEPLLFMFRRFLERLILRITAVYRLIAEVRLTLLLEDGNKIERQLQIPAPTRDIEILFRIVSQYLDTVQASAPVVGFALEAIPRNPGQNQFDLFQSGLKDPNRFFQTLARLAALLGNDRVGIPERTNTHKPDGVRLRMPAFDSERQQATASGSERQRMAASGRQQTEAIDTDQSEDQQLRIGVPLRRFRPPYPVDVQLSKDKPAWICGHSVTGQVRIARGPWRTSGNWWNLDRWDTQEWDVELEDGALYRLSFSSERQRTTTNDSKRQRTAADGTGRWVIVGVYD